MNGSDFVDRIDALLEQRNEKRLAICSYADIPPQTISNWKTRGNFPSADIALKIADYLGVSVEWLVTGKDSTGVDGELQSLMRELQTMPEEKKNNIIIALKAMLKV